MRKSSQFFRPTFILTVSAALLFSAVSVYCFVPTSAADIDKPTQTDRQIAIVVSEILKQNDHLTKRSLDDEISRRGLNNFLKNLDPMKLYFLQSDIDEFNQHQNSIDDMIKRGQLDLSVTIFKRFLQRVDERVAVAHELIDQTHDFTVDEEMITDPDLATYPRDAQEARERWRKRIKYNFLVLKAEKSEPAKAKEKLHRRYTSFAKRMQQFDSEEVVEMFLTAITSSFDPHTTYMSKSSFENFQIMMKLNLEGIGASLQWVDGLTTVKRIVPGGAADRSGQLKVEDRIVSVGQGEDGEMLDVVDMKLDDVVQKIRGKAGTIVRLGVMPATSNDVQVYKITRERIELKDSEAQGEVFDLGKKADGTPYKIGVIDLPSFYSDMEGARKGVTDFKSTTRDVQKIIKEFKQQGVDGVVLDLRFNGGGSLREAINCTGLFIDIGPVVQVKDSYGNIHPLHDEDRGMAWDGPLVVVTSKFSASASEILAGAIKDYRRGIIVGDEATHGKGTVQTLLNLGNAVLGQLRNPTNKLGALKVTIQQFYRPNGDSTQIRGVRSDVVLPSITNHMDVGEGDLDFALEFDKIREVRFDKMGLVSAPLVKHLQERSVTRRANSEKFQKVERDIALYLEQKERKTVTLNEAKFFERRKELDADKQDEKTLEKQLNSEKSSIKRDYYLDEILEITVDYTQGIARR